MGELRQWQCQGGGVTGEKMRAALASKLTARASGCSLLARWLKRQRGARDPAPIHPVLLRHTGSSAGTPVGHSGLSGLDDTTVLGQDFLFAMAFADLLRQEVTWHGQRASGNDDSILFYLYSVFFFFFFFSHISVSTNKKKSKINNNKKRGKAHVSGTVTFLFFQVFGFLCFRGLLVWRYFTVLKKGTKYQFKGKKTAIMPTNNLFYCISVVFTCFCLKTNTWIYMYVCICII